MPQPKGQTASGCELDPPERHAPGRVRSWPGIAGPAEMGIGCAYGTELMEKIHITKEGLEKLKTEIAQMQKRRLEVASVIEHARSLGDLKENAEYHAAKEEQAMLHARLRNAEDKLARSVIIDEKDIDASKAFIGATVTVLNHKTKKEVSYTLVSPVEADMDTNRISVKSPVGQALLGKTVGDVAIAKVPAGELKLEILNISR